MSRDLEYNLAAAMRRGERGDNLLRWYWLEYHGEGDSPEKTFRSACIVRAHGPITAQERAHEMKCASIGKVLYTYLPESLGELDPKWRNRPLSLEETREIYDELKKRIANVKRAREFDR